jgi:hypothetical protein
MRMRASRFAALSAAVVLAACATDVPPHEALPIAARDQISSTELEVPVQQTAIYVDVPPSNLVGTGAGAAFGTFGMLALATIDASVDSIRTDKAETAVKPLCAAMTDFNFDTTLQDSINASLSQLPWTHIDTVRVAKDATDSNLDNLLTSSKDAAVMFTKGDYKLSNDADELTLTVMVSLFPNSDALRALKPVTNDKVKTGPENTLYHNTFVFETKAPGVTDDRDHNIAIWAADHGALTRASLTMGATKIAAMIADDIQRTPDQKVASNGKVQVDGNDLDLIGGDTDGSIIRNEDETMLFADNSVIALSKE